MTDLHEMSDPERKAQRKGDLQKSRAYLHYGKRLRRYPHGGSRHGRRNEGTLGRSDGDDDAVAAAQRAISADRVARLTNRRLPIGGRLEGIPYGEVRRVEP
jgi:hypothetical protein